MWWRQYEDGNTARQGIQVIEQIVAATKRFGFVESTNNISGRSQPSVGRDYLVSPALFRQRDRQHLDTSNLVCLLEAQTI
jgi:hypothetical protein